MNRLHALTSIKTPVVGVAQGHHRSLYPSDVAVICVRAAEDRDLGMEDYLRLGVLDALKAVRTIVPERKVNVLGYCLGGTLLSIAAAFLAREGESALNQLGCPRSRACLDGSWAA
jgi:thioesterase domain-containing protein